MSYEVVCDSHADRDAWLKARKSGIGASEISSLFRCGFRSKYALWAIKTGRMVDHVSDDQLRRFEIGHAMEPVIVDLYSRDHYSGRQSRLAGELLRSKAHPWMMATLDAWTVHEKHGDVPLEVKTHSDFDRDSWQNGAPVPYQYQVWQQSIVADTPLGSIACFFGATGIAWDDVERNTAIEDVILEKGERFWWHVQNDKAPEVDGSDSTRLALGRVFPEHRKDASIALPGEFIDMADELAALKAGAKDGKKRISEIENQLRAAIGDAETGVLPNGVTFTLRTQQRKESVIKASTFRVLRRKKVA